MINKITLKKVFGDIDLTYELNLGDFPTLLKAECKGEVIFEGNRKLVGTYILKDNKDYIGFQLFNEEYENFCKLTGLKANDSKAFISFSDTEHKIIKKQMKEYDNKERLKIDFKNELLEAKETGKIIKKKIGMIPCDDKEEECSFDLLTIEIHPNGDIFERKQHTW